MKNFYTVFFLLLMFFVESQSNLPVFSANDIYIQFSEELRRDGKGELIIPVKFNDLINSKTLLTIGEVFPASDPDRRTPAMRRTYRITLGNSTRDIEAVIKKLSNSPLVVYAEKVPERRFYGISNDPLWNSQYHLALLQADSARDIHTGDSAVAIAVVDGGVNYWHEDLHSDIWINYAEDVDGDGFLSPADNDSIDADGNGFLDDVIGWDFVHLPGQGYPGEDDSLADNDPMDFGGHGTHVAGDAAAATNNGLGIASVGGDCRIMCIRAGMTAQNGFGYIYYSVEGIYYAANNGAQVISMSYGGPSPSPTEQQAIDFAYSQGAVCVAAAGNDNSNNPQYPANYNHVVAVAATDEQDLKADFSNYGTWIDVSAPGVDILSTVVSGSYGNMGGTSMSTPIVSGLVGLTAAMFPDYTYDEIVHRVKNNCDNIDTLNPGYAGQLGSGRVNAFKTLDKVIRILAYAILDSASGNNNGRLDYGETAEMVLTLKNTYQNVTGVTVKLTSLNSLIVISDSIASIGIMNLGSTASNIASPFFLTVGSDTSVSLATFRVEISATGGYNYRKILELPIGQREILIVNDDETNGPSKISYYMEALDSLQYSYDVWDIPTHGTPGINEQWYPTIIWYTGEAVQNVLTTNEQQFLQNYLDLGGNLFLTGQNIAYDLVEQQNGVQFFENYLHASYIQNNSNDYSLDGVPGDPIGAGQNFIILGSGGANNQNSPDIITANSPAQYAIVYNAGNQNEQAAIYFSGNYRLVYFAFGWEGINNNGPAKRKEVLERILSWFQTATTINNHDSETVITRTTLYPNYPNPFNPATTISFAIPRPENVTLKIFNSLGQEVRKLRDGRLSPGNHKIVWDGLDNKGNQSGSGIYFIQLRADKIFLNRKILLLR